MIKGREKKIYVSIFRPRYVLFAVILSCKSRHGIFYNIVTVSVERDDSNNNNNMQIDFNSLTILFYQRLGNGPVEIPPSILARCDDNNNNTIIR